MKNLDKLIISFGILALVACSGNQKKELVEPQTSAVPSLNEKKHILWKVSDENSHVWLFGSVHVADSTFYPLDSVIISAFDDSKELAVEVDAGDSAVMESLQTTLLKEGQNTSGPSIKDLASEEMWRVLDSLGTAWNFPVQAMNMFRPWFVTTMLGTLSITSKGLDPAYGLDIVLSTAAKKKGMPVVSLEGLPQQLDAMPGYGLSNEEGYIFLKETVNSLPYTDSLLAELVVAWKAGDVVKLAQILDEEDDIKFDKEIDKCKTEEECAKEKSLKDAYEKKSVDDRNVGMAEKVEGFLRDDRSVFVVVGSAHLVGRTMSVVSLLEKKGYKVERY